MMRDLKSKLLGCTRWVRSENQTPGSLLLKHQFIKWTGFAVVIGGFCWFSNFWFENAKAAAETAAPIRQDVAKMATPLTPVDEREMWVARIQKNMQSAQEEAQEVKQENAFLKERLDVLEQLFKAQRGDIGNNEEKEPVNNLPSSDSLAASKSSPSDPIPPSYNSGQPYPPVGADIGGGYENFRPQEFGNTPPSKSRGSKILRVGNDRFQKAMLKTLDVYLPAGSYAKAVLTSGVTAATATNAQSNPQPIMLRLVDDGNLPRGFKSRVRDAVLLGGCYGDISSERVLCRLETMSWVEKDGTTVEKKVEGWVMGEDGRSGLRGEVVDRSSDVAREAFGAGLLSAVANFFKYEATSSIFPVTPFGQTNALSPKEAIQGAAASGAGSALDKLADFSIKRAEQMQPVILVASGRLVDVVFKSGVDLSPEAMHQEMKVVGASHQDTPQEIMEN